MVEQSQSHTPEIPGPSGTVVCPVCGAYASNIWLVRNHRRARCPSCDVDFCVPFRAADQHWYESAALYAEAAHPAQAILRPSWEQHRVARHVGRGEKVLDVGCGGGVFLREATRRRATCVGLDVQARQLDWARDNAPEAMVFQMTLDDYVASHPAERFDLVTAFHVLEHLPNPLQFLETARQTLRPGGRLAIAVPNRGRLRIERRLDELDTPPHHVTYWSRDALANILCRAGLSAVMVETAPVQTHGMLSRLLSTGLLARAVANQGQANCARRDSAPESSASPEWAVTAYRFKLPLIRAAAFIPDFLLQLFGGEGAVLLATGVHK